jgi:hypothetical protein
MVLSKQEAIDIVYNDSFDFDLVKGTEKIIDHGRWTITKEAIYLSTVDHKYYKFRELYS